MHPHIISYKQYTMKKSIPHNYHSLVTYLTIKHADKAIEFYKKAFGATEIGRITMYDKVGHAELQIGDSILMVAEENASMGK